MNRLFNMDNGIFRFMSKVADGLWVSILFLVSCLPIFTIGAAMTAIYYSVQKVLKHDRGYITSEYWHSFKTNFKQATIIWLIALGLSIVLSLDIYFCGTIEGAIANFRLFFVVLLIFVIIWACYVFPYLSRFVNTTKNIIKNAAFMAILNLPKTLLLVVFIVVMVLVVYLLPVTVFFMPVLFTLAQNFVMEKIFRKFMSEEDRAAEDEMNREYKNGM